MPQCDQENDEQDDHAVYIFPERRPYEIRDPTNNAYLATQNIATFITDHHLAKMIEEMQNEGFFNRENERSRFITIEIHYRCVDMELFEWDRHVAEHEQRKLVEKEEKVRAYNNRIRQPRSLLSIAGQVGPTEVNNFINKDLVGKFRMYLYVLELSGHYPLPVNILARMAWQDSIKCFTLLITKMNQWNKTCHVEALKMYPGMGQVTSFWEITSMIMHAWGATKIIAWMRFRNLYQLGTLQFPIGPVSARHLKMQRRYGVSFESAAPFLEVHEPYVLGFWTKENKGFGNLIIAANKDYLPRHWNLKLTVASSGHSESYSLRTGGHHGLPAGQSETSADCLKFLSPPLKG